MMSNGMAEVRVALRSLRKEPGSTAVAIAALAVGIAACATVFSVVDGVLLRPLPFRDLDRLVAIWKADPAQPDAWRFPAIANFVDWQAESTAFDVVAVGRNRSFTLTSFEAGGTPLMQEVSCGYFPLLGVAPARGRAFSAEECRPGGLLLARAGGAARAAAGRKRRRRDDPAFPDPVRLDPDPDRGPARSRARPRAARPAAPGAARLHRGARHPAAGGPQARRVGRRRLAAGGGGQPRARAPPLRRQEPDRRAPHRAERPRHRHLVARRTREIGVRKALGARPRDVLRLVVGDGVRQAAVGVGIGLPAALALTRVLEGQLYGVRAHDPLTYLGLSLALLLLAAAASALPARRAARTDPRRALSAE
jgi:hypothetical protein